MNNSRKIVIDTLVRFIGQLTMGLITAFSARLITGYLGIDRYGVITAATFFFSMFASLSDAGTTAVAIREIARNPKKNKDILANVLGIRIAGSFILGLACIVLGYIIYTPKDPRIFEALVWMVSGLTLINISSAFKITLTTTFRAKALVISDILSRLLGLIFLWYGIHYDWGIWVVYAAPLLTLFLSSILVIVLNKKEYRVRPKFDQEQWRIIIKYVIPLAITTILNTLYLRADGMLLSFYKSSVEVGQYGLAYKIVELLGVLPSLFALVAMSSVANSDKDLLHKQTILGQKYLGFVGVLSSFAIISIGPFIIKILSNNQSSFAPSFAPLVILLCANIVIFYHQPISNALVVQNLQNQIMKISIYTTIFNIVINLFMIPMWGIIGAASAVLITEILIYIYFRKLYKKHINSNIGIMSFKPLMAGIIMFLTANVTRYYLRSSGLNEIIIEILSLGIATIVFILVVIFTRFTSFKEMNELLRRV